LEVAEPGVNISVFTLKHEERKEVKREVNVVEKKVERVVKEVRRAESAQESINLLSFRESILT
jgi:hypothetical protein